MDRMDDARSTKKIYQNNLHQKRPNGRPKGRWKEYVENDVRQMGIVNWRQVEQDGDGWRRATKESFIFFGYCSHIIMIIKVIIIIACTSWCSTRQEPWSVKFQLQPETEWSYIHSNFICLQDLRTHRAGSIRGIKGPCNAPRLALSNQLSLGTDLYLHIHENSSSVLRCWGK
jgi:hypothetical protein